ncbi:MAG TPA: CRISPR-associated endonuclease Cas1 [Chloroflexus aurantiacus]|jgi:CRISPR-associated protein Cas1|uniref:CRISPR-associated endonuclease Cas1 n=1 Tax=Chloroflexus aurantiacus (strain ATCC 29366 / DSM 635 / J-10-fl) TaxID=324602 RepID=A9WJV4_CHLAA|nr:MULTISPECIES: CRISPR-associated endonuclease Cas1 [Chloroflexus]ABY36570.1 CRISPR-associated protein Cas1 [Chloroflexus aurantiacus J-10-fl]HBW67986.1 CRISPR-associated endonuclease Cas1 [Chloroflexus aurantiacus]
MATLYIQEQGTTVRKRDNQIIIIRDGSILQEIPLNKVDQIVLMGRGVQISTALLVELLLRGIPVMITNQHGSRHYATLSAGPSRFGPLRLRQSQLIIDPVWSLELVRGIVAAKLAAQRLILSGTGWPSAAGAIAQIDTALQRLPAATTLDIARGFEGAAAAAYFGAWRNVFQQGWGFQGRAFHPPPDPINALLSFGYTLLLHDVLSAVQFTGLDPYLGVFHAVETGRPSLALDVMEEFRPLVVDRLVLSLITTGTITRSQFVRTQSEQPNAIYLTPDARKLVVSRYEALMKAPFRLSDGTQTAMRRVILLQTQMVARMIRGEQAAYEGVIR